MARNMKKQKTDNFSKFWFVDLRLIAFVALLLMLLALWLAA
jgi:hypothetical protein